MAKGLVVKFTAPVKFVASRVFTSLCFIHIPCYVTTTLTFLLKPLRDNIFPLRPLSVPAKAASAGAAAASWPV